MDSVVSAIATESLQPDTPVNGADQTPRPAPTGTFSKMEVTLVESRFVVAAVHAATGISEGFTPKL